MLKSEKSKGMLAAVGVYVIWGFTLLASTVAQRAATPMVFLMYRFDLAALIMLVPLLLGKQRISLNRKKLIELLLLGLTEPVIYFPCEQFGLKYTNSSFAGIMIALIPVFTMLLAALFLRDKPSRLQWFFSLVSIGGVIWITLIESSDSGVIQPIGVALLALAVVCGGAYSVMCRRFEGSTSIYERTLVTMVCGAVFFTVSALAENRADLSALYTPLRDTGFVVSALYVAIFASVIGYTLLNMALARAPIANVVSLNNLVTVLSVLSGIVFLHEPYSAAGCAAMLVVLVGIWGVQRFSPTKQGIKKSTQQTQG